MRYFRRSNTLLRSRMLELLWSMCWLIQDTTSHMRSMRQHLFSSMTSRRLRNTVNSNIAHGNQLTGVTVNLSMKYLDGSIPKHQCRTRNKRRNEQNSILIQLESQCWLLRVFCHAAERNLWVYWWYSHRRTVESKRKEVWNCSRILCQNLSSKQLRNWLYPRWTYLEDTLIWFMV